MEVQNNKFNAENGTYMDAKERLQEAETLFNIAKKFQAIGRNDKMKEFCEEAKEICYKLQEYGQTQNYFVADINLLRAKIDQILQSFDDGIDRDTNL